MNHLLDSFKEPWEMTRDEFVERRGDFDFNWYKKFGWMEGSRYNEDLGYAKATGHRVLVKSALKKGLSVPPPKFLLITLHSGSIPEQATIGG